MKDKNFRSEKWTPCPPGFIKEAARETSRSRRSLIGIIGIGAVVSAVGGGTALGLVFSNGPQDNANSQMPAGIACIQVHNNLAEYLAGKIKNSELKERITLHLLNCRDCRKEYDGLCASKSGCITRPSKATLKPCPKNCPSP